MFTSAKYPGASAAAITAGNIRRWLHDSAETLVRLPHFSPCTELSNWAATLPDFERLAEMISTQPLDAGQVAKGVLPILCYTHCPQVLLSSVSSCAMLSAHGTMAEQKQRAEALCKIGMRSKPKNSSLVRDRFICFEQM